jgi:hypothetical protein
VAGSYAIDASPRARGLLGGYNSVQVEVPAGDVVVVGVVTPALFGAGVEVHPPDAAMHRIAIAKTACEHSDRGVGCERHPSDERLALGCAGVVTPFPTQSSRSRFPPHGLTRCVEVRGLRGARNCCRCPGRPRSAGGGWPGRAWRIYDPVMGRNPAGGGVVVGLLGPVEIGPAGGVMASVAQPRLRH